MLIHEGRIKAAFEAGVFVLKLCGDVRLTLCATLDRQARQLAETPGLASLIIDLRDATNVDSTALGFLAKVAMAVEGRLPERPTIVADNPDIRQMLDVMGFARYFTVVEAPITEVCELCDLPETPGLASLIIDLRDATNVDSTALGFLAKVAMAVEGRLPERPTIVADNPDIRQMLDVMGFARYFTVVEAPITEVCELCDLPEIPCDVEETRQRILEAHRILMHMNEHNREEFQPLVEILEAQEATPHRH